MTDLAFERRLATSEGRTVTGRLRVIDTTDTEHVIELNRIRRVDTSTATSTPSPTPTAALLVAVGVGSVGRLH